MRLADPAGLWQTFASIKEVARRYDVPTLEIIRAVQNDPDKDASRYNLYATSAAAAANDKRREQTHQYRNIPLLEATSSTIEGVKDGSLAGTLDDGFLAYRAYQETVDIDSDIPFEEAVQDLDALTLKYVEDGINLKAMIDAAPIVKSAARNLEEFLAAHPSVRGSVLGYIASAPSWKQTRDALTQANE